MTGLYDEVRLAIHLVWTRRWLALAVAWAICLLGWLVVAQIPDSYMSRARIFVQLQSLLPGKIGISEADQQKTVDQIRQTLTSSTNLAKIVRTTSLANSVANDRDVTDRVAGLQQAIKINAQQDNLFEITASTPSPKLSRSVVQKLIDIFVEQNLAGNRDETSQTLQFLDAQLAQRQKQLQDSETKRADFQNRYLGSLPGAGSLNDRIGAARTQLAQVDSDLAAAQSSLAAVNGQMAGTQANIGNNGVATAGPARARVMAIQGQLADARARGWTDSHPDVIALKTQLAAAQAAAANEPLGAGPNSNAPNPLFFSLRSLQADKQSQVAALSARKTQLQSDLNSLQAMLSQNPDIAAQQAQLERDYTVLKDQYDKMLQDREDVRLRGQVQSQTDAVKFSVIDPPTTPNLPTAPNRPLLLSAVLAVGLVGGVGAAFGLAKLHTTFATAGRLESASGLPVIGSIGRMMTPAQLMTQRRRLMQFAGGTAALLVAYVALIGVEFIQRGLAA